MSAELNISVNLLASKISLGNDFVFGIDKGGGKRGSIAILKAF
jgi:hypothetical protein